MRPKWSPAFDQSQNASIPPAERVHQMYSPFRPQCPMSPQETKFPQFFLQCSSGSLRCAARNRRDGGAIGACRRREFGVAHGNADLGALSVGLRRETLWKQKSHPKDRMIGGCCCCFQSTTERIRRPSLPIMLNSASMRRTMKPFSVDLKGLPCGEIRFRQGVFLTKDILSGVLRLSPDNAPTAVAGRTSDE